MQVATKPLPLKWGPVLDAGACYDLWAAHRASGAVDTENVCNRPATQCSADCCFAAPICTHAGSVTCSLTLITYLMLVCMRSLITFLSTGWHRTQ